MKRRLTGLAVAILAAASVLAGCGDSPAEGGTKTIKFMAAEYSSGTKPYWDGVKKNFEAANPGYQVDIEVVNWEQIDQKVKTLVQTRQQPDVLNLNKFADFARDELLYPAEEVLSPETKGEFLPVFAEQSNYNGKQYGLPFISSVRLFFYNKDIFAKAGITAPPASWADVKTAAQKIKDSGAIGLGLPLGAEEAQGEFFMWAMNNNGGWTSGADWAIDQQANVDTLNFLKELNQAGLTQPNPETTNRKDVFNLFAQGKIGMLNGAVFLPKSFIDPVNPNLPYGVAPLPSKDGQAHQTLGVADFLMAFRKDGDANKDAVTKFLNFVYQKDNAVKFLKAEGFLPVTRSAAAELSADPYLKQFVDQLANAKFAPTDRPEWQAVDGATKQNVGSAVANADPKTVLGQMAQAAKRSGN